jgi:hypothetical protein
MEGKMVKLWVNMCVRVNEYVKERIEREREKEKERKRENAVNDYRNYNVTITHTIYLALTNKIYLLPFRVCSVTITYKMLTSLQYNNGTCNN